MTSQVCSHALDSVDPGHHTQGPRTKEHLNNQQVLLRNRIRAQTGVCLINPPAPPPWKPPHWLWALTVEPLIMICY